MEVLSLNLGENISRLRAARGMSQGDLPAALDKDWTEMVGMAPAPDG